jgi:hypothetical protein
MGKLFGFLGFGLAGAALMALLAMFVLAFTI